MAIDMEKVVKDWFAAWNSRDVDKIIRFYADDGIIESVYREEVFKGKNGMLEFVKADFVDYPDLKIEQKATFYSANAVCGEVVFVGTHAHSSNPAVPATGKHFSIRGAYISEWQNGKIKRHAIYMDSLTLMRQVGLMPGIPSKK